MRTRIVFPTGVADVHAEWTSGPFEWGLWQVDWTPDEASQVMVADISGTEITAGGYARQPVATPTVSVVLPGAAGDVGFVEYLCDDPTFGVLSGGETATWLVLSGVGGSDADSPIVCAYAIAQNCDGIQEAQFPLPATGAHAVATTCSGVF